MVPPLHPPGDNIHTARHIARECGILEEGEGHTCMEGPEFRNTEEAEMIERLPNLRVGVMGAWVGVVPVC